MTRLILAGLILLSFTACKERHGPQPTTSKFTGEVFSSSLESTEVEEISTIQERPKQLKSETTVLQDIPILEDDLPTLPLSEERSTTMPTQQHVTQKTSVSGGNITDGLNIGEIRVSEGTERTRIVFDSYSATDVKASVSGHYTFKYLPEQNRITLVVNGYRQFSALGNSKLRTFSENSIIKKIYLTKRLDDSSFQCNIDLRQSANVNAFDIKEPGRIVIDVSPL